MNVPDDASYALVARRVAVSNILSSLAQDSLGTLTAWTVEVDASGGWRLSVRACAARDTAMLRSGGRG
jgi:hypothetical protein